MNGTRINKPQEVDCDAARRAANRCKPKRSRAVFRAVLGGAAAWLIACEDGGLPTEHLSGTAGGGAWPAQTESLTAASNDVASRADEEASAASDGPSTYANDTASQSGSARVLDQTIVVKAGQTFDGKGGRFVAGKALGDGSQSESQKPLFKLERGATLINVVLGSPAADGVHCHGDATLRNIVWEDIGEDAMTIKEKGTVTLDGGSARDGADKVFQINAESTFKVSNFRAQNAGKFARQNGGTKFKVAVYIDKCDISDMKEAIFRTDSSISTVQMTNTRYSNIGKALFMGVKSANIKTSNNTEY